MKDNSVPEEKLLKLISGQKKMFKPPLKEDKSPIGPEANTAKNAQAKGLIKHKAWPSLSVNQIIIIVFIISVICLAAAFIYPMIVLKEVKLPAYVPEKVGSDNKNTKEEVRPYSFYLQGLQGRQVFSAAASQESEIATNVGVDLMKDLSLVGIIAGDKPQAIIEDKKNQKSFYVNKGQFIREFKIEDIQEGKVTLSYNGQRFELTI